MKNEVIKASTEFEVLTASLFLLLKTESLDNAILEL